MIDCEMHHLVLILVHAGSDVGRDLRHAIKLMN